MFTQAFQVTIRILFFRAGPQDFPYVTGVTPVLLMMAVAANALVFSSVLPLSMALGIALAMAAALAMVTRAILRMRNFANRFQQTFNSLLATTLLLTLALLPPFSQIAPQILELAKHPEILQNPDAVKLPALPVLVMNLINFWSFGVTAHIYRHAAGVNLWVGMVIAFVSAGIMLFIGMLGGTIAGAMFGAPVG